MDGAAMDVPPFRFNRNRDSILAKPFVQYAAVPGSSGAGALSTLPKESELVK
jgi:hypothetical protein